MAGTAVSRGVPREIKQGRLQVPVIDAGSIPRVQYSSGSAQALQAFSRDMFSLADGFQDQLDQTAEAEATSAGAVQGMTGDFELQSYGTIRGRAFNKAAIETFVTTVETQSIFKVQELQTRFGADPAQLQKELDAYAGGVAGEVEKIYPPAGAAFRQRLALRSAPAVEAARDARYKLTREQADAALIENEVALKAEISSLAGDLFSENPARSEAASAAVGALQREYLQVFEAVDPTTGQPLYNAEERAKAKVGFYEDVMEHAAMGWFEQQPDKAGAYVKFTEGDFTINLQSAPSVKLSPEIGGIIDAAAARYGVPAEALRTIAWIESKGKANAQNPNSSAGGLFQFIDSTARQYGLSNKLDPVANADAAARLTADNMAGLRQLLGRDPLVGELYLAHQQGLGGATALLGNPGELAVNVVGYDAVKLNGGSPGMSAGQFAALWTKKANSVSRTAEKQTVDVRKALPAEAMGRIESEMRARIGFRNQLADRQEAAEEKNVKAFQDAAEFELTNRVYNDGATDPETGEPVQPLTREEIQERVRKGFVTPDGGQRLIKALETEKPQRSDPATFRDVERRMYEGEDVSNFIFEHADKLSKEDASSLLSRNQTMNVSGEGGLSKEGTFYERQLVDLLTPDSLMAKIDEGAEDRKFLALGEYRRRVKEGELPEAVADDLRTRASLTFSTITNTKLDTMVRPRYSIMSDKGRLDIRASAVALNKAMKDKKITVAEYERQKAVLIQWDDLQTAAARAQGTAKPGTTK